MTNLGAAPLVDSAFDEEIPDFARSLEVSAKLTEINGERNFTLKPSFVEAKSLGAGSYKVTYEVGIPKEYLLDESELNKVTGSFNLFPISVKASSDSHNGCDSTVSVCATLTLYYTQISGHGWYQYTTNRWTRSDGTVSWSNAKLKASCNAEWYLGSGRCNTTTTSNIGVPRSGTTYSLTPGFAGSSNQVVLNGYNGIAAFQQITLTRGLSTWNFGFCVNQGGGQVIVGCY